MTTLSAVGPWHTLNTNLCRDRIPDWSMGFRQTARACSAERETKVAEKSKLFCAGGRRSGALSPVCRLVFLVVQPLPSFHASEFRPPRRGRQATVSCFWRGPLPLQGCILTKKGVISVSKGDVCATHRRRPPKKVRVPSQFLPPNPNCIIFRDGGVVDL